MISDYSILSFAVHWSRYTYVHFFNSMITINYHYKHIHTLLKFAVGSQCIYSKECGTYICISHRANLLSERGICKEWHRCVSAIWCKFCKGKNVWNFIRYVVGCKQFQSCFSPNFCRMVHFIKALCMITRVDVDVYLKTFRWYRRVAKNKAYNKMLLIQISIEYLGMYNIRMVKPS